MSDEVQNPIDEMNPSSPDEAREIAAALVRNCRITVQDANANLLARGAIPLVENSLEMAQAEKDRLMQNDAFVDRYLNGEPDAMKTLNDLDARIARSGRALTDHDPLPTDYKFDTVKRFPDASDDEITAHDANLATWAAASKMPPENARAIVSLAHDADKIPAHQREEWRERQGFILQGVLGANAAERIAAATKVLREASGRPMELADIAKNAGAEAAMNLLFHAEHLAATPKR